MTPPAARIDAHHHLWDLSVRDQDWITPDMAVIQRDFSVDDLAATVSGFDISGTVNVQCVLDIDETRELLVTARDSELVRAVVGWVDLTSDTVADDIASLMQGPGGQWLRGIRHVVQAEPDPRWLCRPDVLRGLAAVGAAGLAYDILTVPHQLPAAIEAVRANPQLTFVVDHCSKPLITTGELEPWATLITSLAQEPNVFCKISGLVTEADWAAWTVTGLKPYVDTVVTAFGPDRVMFGSDWPACLVASSYGEWLAAAEELTSGLSPDEQESFWHGNATRAYRLDTTGGS